MMWHEGMVVSVAWMAALWRMCMLPSRERRLALTQEARVRGRASIRPGQHRVLAHLQTGVAVAGARWATARRDNVLMPNRRRGTERWERMSCVEWLRAEEGRGVWSSRAEMVAVHALMLCVCVCSRACVSCVDAP